MATLHSSKRNLDSQERMENTLVVQHRSKVVPIFCADLILCSFIDWTLHDIEVCEVTKITSECHLTKDFQANYDSFFLVVVIARIDDGRRNFYGGLLW